MMYCYYRQNNRPQALRWYHRCREKLDGKSDRPMPATERMYVAGDADEECQVGNKESHKKVLRIMIYEA